MTRPVTRPAPTVVTEDPDCAGVRERVLSAVRRHALPTLGIGVVQDDRVVCCRVLRQGDGRAGEDHGQGTTFGLGSNSKLFPLLGILRLIELGAVRLDDPVNWHLSSLQVVGPRGRDVTILDLLTHTGGLASWRRRRDLLRWGNGEILEPGQARPDLRFFYGSRVVATQPPGRYLRYTDHGYALLSQLVSDTTSTRFEDFLTQQVLWPLGMHQTGYPPYAGLPAPLAGHGWDGRPVAPLDHVLVPSTGAISSARDMTLLVWALSHGGRHRFGVALEPGTVEQIYRPWFRLHPRFPALGLLLIVCGAEGSRVGIMRGTYNGWSSWIVASGDLRLGIILLADVQATLDRLGRDILKACTGRPEVAALDLAVVAAGRKLGPSAGHGTTASLPRSYRGVYGPMQDRGKERVLDYSRMDVLVKTARSGLVLRGVWPRSFLIGEAAPLLPDTEGDPDLFTINFPWGPIHVYFERDDRGRVQRLIFAPFDAYRRLPWWEVPLLPVRNALAHLRDHLVWLAGSRGPRRRTR